jgi:hypothetical protein
MKIIIYLDSLKKDYLKVDIVAYNERSTSDSGSQMEGT